MERLRNKWFLEAKAEKLKPIRQMEWSGAEDQNPWRVVVSKEE
jgi:hypothetical protein